MVFVVPRRSWGAPVEPAGVQTQTEIRGRAFTGEVNLRQAPRWRGATELPHKGVSSPIRPASAANEFHDELPRHAASQRQAPGFHPPRGLLVLPTPDPRRRPHRRWDDVESIVHLPLGQAPAPVIQC